MDNKLLLSRRVMQLLVERLKEDLWWSQEQRDMYENDCKGYQLYQDAVDEDEKLINEIEAKLNS